MSADPLDRIDEGILYYLQEDARNATTTEMGEKLGVAGSTIRNRIDRLENEGVLEGYRPEIGYGPAGLGLQMVFVCTAPEEPSDVVDAVIDAEGVVGVRELLADERNLHVEAAGEDAGELTRIADSLRELGLEIVRSDVVTARRSRPFNHFDEPPE